MSKILGEDVSIPTFFTLTETLITPYFPRSQCIFYVFTYSKLKLKLI